MSAGKPSSFPRALTSSLWNSANGSITLPWRKKKVLMILSPTDIHVYLKYHYVKICRLLPLTCALKLRTKSVSLWCVLMASALLLTSDEALSIRSGRRVPTNERWMQQQQKTINTVWRYRNKIHVHVRRSLQFPCPHRHIVTFYHYFRGITTFRTLQWITVISKRI